MEVDFFLDPIKQRHWGDSRFQAHIFKDVFDEKTLKSLEVVVKSQLSRKTLTYGTHRTTFSFKGKNNKIVSHAQNNREQQVVYDLTFTEDYWHQTKDTIKDWSNEYIINNVNPVFYKFIKFFEGQVPFNQEPNDWIPFRLHINVLEYTKFLLIHTDMNSQYFNTKNTNCANAYSLTFYLEDYVDGQGGELYTDTGFSYKPIKNSALCINGNSCLHGVAANMKPDKSPRLAFTVRWAHKDDLYLPGHPSKTLYKLDF
jgi:hypothetical protein